VVPFVEKALLNEPPSDHAGVLDSGEWSQPVDSVTENVTLEVVVPVEKVPRS
jgi:hypothetical protein